MIRSFGNGDGNTASVFYGVGLTGVSGSAVANLLGIEPHCALNRSSRLQKNLSPLQLHRRSTRMYLSAPLSESMQRNTPWRLSPFLTSFCRLISLSGESFHNRRSSQAQLIEDYLA
ncbi:hypothetical protein WN51_04755 [Melipona quadrifasciata]|uniref:Uncharacterized protein n=1 Tax=Melipona quadrifasciata TaxID=166423 RepID=A0A0N0U413_9HYME|nr:hypothetical protein WN51_04755 [Melipona quadrifasciata]